MPRLSLPAFWEWQLFPQMIGLLSRVGLIVFCLLGWGGTSAFAASEPLIKYYRPKTLIVLGQTFQSLTLSYNYHSNDSESKTRTSNRFTEKYHLSTEADILDKKFMKLFLDIDVLLDQRNSSGTDVSTTSSARERFNYNFRGKAFITKPYPISFYSSQTMQYMTPISGDSYDSYSTANGFHASYSNEIMPLQLSYARRTVETSGSRGDATSASNTVAFSANHSIGDLSYSQFDYQYTTEEQDYQDVTTSTDQHLFSLMNNLTFGRGRKYSLGSSLNWRHGETDAFGWGEVLSAQFGKALRGELMNQHSRTEINSSQNTGNEYTLNSTTGLLSHMLYKSLENRLIGRYSTLDYLGGEQISQSIAYAVNYDKNLPSASHLRVSFASDFQWTERDISATDLQLERRYQSVQPGQVIELELFDGALLEIISVEGINPVILFEPYIDYYPDYALGQINVLDPGEIAPGTDLVVTYKIRSDPTGGYRTDNYVVTTNLSLLKNKYRITMQHQETSQVPTSGRVRSQSLVNSSRNYVKLDASFEPFEYALTVSNYETDRSKTWSIAGSMRYYRLLTPLSRLRAFLKNTYSENEGSGSNDSRNVFSSNIVYDRTISSNARANLRLDYLNYLSGNGIDDKQRYGARLEYQTRIGRVFMVVSGQTSFEDRQNTSRRDDDIRIELTRYF